jgi:hypothetical protein
MTVWIALGDDSDTHPECTAEASMFQSSAKCSRKHQKTSRCGQNNLTSTCRGRPSTPYFRKVDELDVAEGARNEALSSTHAMRKHIHMHRYRSSEFAPRSSPLFLPPASFCGV